MQVAEIENILVNLEENVWSLESYGSRNNVTTLLADTEATAKFSGTEKSVTGSGGCNTCTDGYELSENILTIQAPLSLTLISCGEEEVGNPPPPAGTNPGMRIKLHARVLMYESSPF